MAVTDKHTKIVDNLIEMKDVVVPILGEDVFFISSGHKRLTIHEYLLYSFIEEYGERHLTDEDKAIILKGSYYGLSKLERFFPDDFESDYRRYVRGARKRDILHIDPAIKEFLEEFRFPLIITSSPFNMLEDMIEGVKYKCRSYSPCGVNNAPIDPAVPTVYHIFGTIGNGGQWVYDEDKLLEFLHALHNADTTSTGLKHYIDTKNCRLLALGCNLPDWLFRFLWFPIKSSTIDHRQKKGYWINERQNSESFNDFLDNIKFYSTHEVEELLRLAVEELRKQHQEAEKEEEEGRYDAFLSYASEDKPLAREVYNTLTSQGLKIWFDKDGNGKIAPGSNYMKRITSGVARSDYYLPLITENFITKALNPESNLKKELDIVREHYKSFPEAPERYSIPLIVEGRAFNEQPITSRMIEEMARYMLPKQLFFQINMYSFSETDIKIDIEI